MWPSSCCRTRRYVFGSHQKKRDCQGRLDLPLSPFGLKNMKINKHIRGLLYQSQSDGLMTKLRSLERSSSRQGDERFLSPDTGSLVSSTRPDKRWIYHSQLASLAVWTQCSPNIPAITKDKGWSMATWPFFVLSTSPPLVQDLPFAGKNLKLLSGQVINTDGM